MRKHTWMRRAAPAALLGGLLGACDFISISDADPNTVSNPTMGQLFVGAQVNSYLIAEGELARTAAVWTQQLFGAERQYSSLNRYEITETHVDGEFSGLYTGGGLVDLRLGEAKAEEEGCAGCKALFQIHEAFLIGTAASLWGDIPYSEAVNAAEFPTPHLDQQAQVYAAVQAKLDSAIAVLGTGTVLPFRGLDFNFAGSEAKWRAAAFTLKARYYMHWVEAQAAGGQFATDANTACGGNCLDKALAAAQNGIMTPGGNWRGIHGTATTEQNLFYQFNDQRSGYVLAGDYLSNLLASRDDPRLDIYFADGALNISGAAAPNYAQPIVSCAENQFIIAEVEYRKGNTAGAQAALAAGVACQEALFGVDIPVNTALTGTALFNEIMTQKYIALFLNIETYNDYKRTCLPAITPVTTDGVPGRLLYGRTERQTNPNIPPPDEQPLRNDNDPAGCSVAAD